MLLPSDITVILENCHLRMADGVYSQMFRNSNAYTPVGKTVRGEQHNIRIIGIGNAILDGGCDNGLNEYTSEKNGMPPVYENLTVHFNNVSNFVLDNFTIVDQRWWAISCSFCERGKISGINFRLDYRDAPCWRNQDGIDLRLGCRDIIIEDITGETADDCIAMTAVCTEDSLDSRELVEGKPTDICNITVDRVLAFSNMTSVVRILSQQGNRVHNISITNIIDTSRVELDSKVQMLLRIGENGYYNGIDEMSKPGDISDIYIKNIHTRALSALQIDMAVRNLHASDIFVHTDGHYIATIGSFNVLCPPGEPIVLYKPEYYEKQRQQTLYDCRLNTGVTAENILIENVYCTAVCDSQNYRPALFAFNCAEMKSVVIRGIHCSEPRRTADFWGDNTLSELKIEREQANENETVHKTGDSI